MGVGGHLIKREAELFGDFADGDDGLYVEEEEDTRLREGRKEGGGVLRNSGPV